MSYQGLHIDRNKKYWVRYRVKGEVIEAGPYDSAAEALRANMGRSTPPLQSVNRGIIIEPVSDHAHTVKE